MYVFVYARTYAENGGVFVCKARHLLLAGATAAPNRIGSNTGMTPFMLSPQHRYGIGLTNAPTTELQRRCGSVQGQHARGENTGGTNDNDGAEDAQRYDACRQGSAYYEWRDEE